MLQAIAQETGVDPILQYSQVRPGDQPLYISNTAKLGEHTGWQPRRSLLETLQAIHRFWRVNRIFLTEQRKRSDAAAANTIISEEVA